MSGMFATAPGVAVLCYGGGSRDVAAIVTVASASFLASMISASKLSSDGADEDEEGMGMRRPSSRDR
jgi:hypothetical protein